MRYQKAAKYVFNEETVIVASVKWIEFFIAKNSINPKNHITAAG